MASHCIASSIIQARMTQCPSQCRISLRSHVKTLRACEIRSLKQQGVHIKRRSCSTVSPLCALDAAAPEARRNLGLIQHKNEAKIFYKFLSIVYDYIVNPGHWTVDMREDALEPALLSDPSLKVFNSITGLSASHLNTICAVTSISYWLGHN